MCVRSRRRPVVYPAFKLGMMGCMLFCAGDIVYRMLIYVCIHCIRIHGGIIMILLVILRAQVRNLTVLCSKLLLEGLVQIL